MKHLAKLLSLALIITIITSAVPDVYGADLNEAVEHSHEYYAQLITESSCEEDGIALYVCACGDEYEGTVKATGHKYTVINYVESTQTQSGYTVYRCSVCGDEYTETTEQENQYVAKIYICAKRQFSPLGHLWVYIHNTSDQPIEVGVYTVPVDQGVSIGTFGVTRADGPGIYYNVEAYAVNKFGLKSMVCLEDDLTESELEKVSSTIRNSNVWDPIIFNCMTAAFSIWNAGALIKLIPLVFPALGRIQMLMYPHSDQLDMYYPTEDQVFKQRGIGNNARLEKVRENTLSHRL